MGPFSLFDFPPSFLKYEKQNLIYFCVFLEMFNIDIVNINYSSDK